MKKIVYQLLICINIGSNHQCNLKISKNCDLCQTLLKKTVYKSRKKHIFLSEIIKMNDKNSEIKMYLLFIDKCIINGYLTKNPHPNLYELT